MSTRWLLAFFFEGLFDFVLEIMKIFVVCIQLSSIVIAESQYSSTLEVELWSFFGESQ